MIGIGISHPDGSIQQSELAVKNSDLTVRCVTLRKVIGPKEVGAGDCDARGETFNMMPPANREKKQVARSNDDIDDVHSAKQWKSLNVNAGEGDLRGV